MKYRLRSIALSGKNLNLSGNHFVRGGFMVKQYKSLNRLVVALVILAQLMSSVGYANAAAGVTTAQPSVVASRTVEAPKAAADGGTVTGTVFQDFNANGTFDNTALSKDIQVPSVTVKAYDSTGANVGTTTTVYCTGAGAPQSFCTGANAGPNYSLTVTGTGPYRIEFTNLPAGFYPSTHSTDSVNGGTATNAGTSTQFVPNLNTANVNLAINVPADYGQPDPWVAVPLYYNGTAANNSSQPGVVIHTYGADSFTPNLATLATADQVGSVWGMAYQPTQSRLFASSMVRRHVGLAKGPGWVYVLNFTGSSGSLAGSFNLQGVTPANGGAAIDLGSVCRRDTISGGGTTCDPQGTGIASDYTLGSAASANRDLDAFGKVGKVSFGDADMQEDGQTLWLVNLNQRALINVNVSGATGSLPGTVNQYPIAGLPGLPTCTNGVFRPWGLKFRSAKGYLGGVCSEENSSSSTATTNLRAYVLSFDPANVSAGFTTVLNFALNYTRNDSGYNGASATNVPWHPWRATWPTTFDSLHHYSMPIVSDIEFTENGSLRLGVMDRMGIIGGTANYGAISGTTDLREERTGGEVVHACLVSGSYVLEGASGCPAHGFVSNSSGPNGGGYYYNAILGDGHQWGAAGGLAWLPGSGELMIGHVDPYPSSYTPNTPNGDSSTWYSQGTGRLSSSSGAHLAGAMIVQAQPGSDLPFFGKASGLGDIELLLGATPIELGNRVWQDGNGNGLQDPGENENGIASVTVELYKGGTKVGQATTDGNGEYYFGGPACVNGLASSGPTKTETFPVLASSDDAEQSVNSGTTDVNDASLNMPYEVGSSTVQQYTGLRFQGVTIPQGATITNAKIVFTAADAGSTTVNLTIKGQAADNAATFTISTNDISSRSQTTASVNWSSVPAWSAGESGADTTTPALTSIVQEIVNRAGWSSGNSMAFVLSNNGTSSPNTRLAAGYDNTTYAEPQLVITYQSAYCVEPNTAYEIRVATSQAPFTGLGLTTANAAQPANGNASATTNDPIKDVADSDAVISGANAVIAYTTGGPGVNNHGLDFGFVSSDYGDAPDTGAGTGQGNYNTLGTDSGPSHAIVANLRLGVNGPDADNGTLQNGAATADDTSNTGSADDEDGVTTLPSVSTISASVPMTISVFNNTGATANLACWIDFNRDGDFVDTGERAATTVSASASQQTASLTFTGFAAPAAGTSYLRCRVATAAGEVANPTGAANTGEVEDYQVTIAQSSDYGDAPDTGAGTGQGNYNTLATDSGPSHAIVANLRLGVNAPDADAGTLQNAAATADDTSNTGSADDEDGVTVLPGVTTISASVPLTVSVFNNTGASATVACWIDFNRDGDFVDTGERAATTVSASASQQTASLTFTGFAAPTAGTSYLRCRVATAAGEVANPTGAANTGEVEDYQVTIAQSSDYGDAPDTGAGTGQGNYNTLATDSGPSHAIVANLRLGVNAPDADAGTLQNAAATADDTSNTGSADDEDGVTVLPGVTTISASVPLTVSVFNNTGASATVACWIDFNRDGDFVDTGERAATTVSASASQQTASLTFTGFAAPTAGTSYLRCRLATAAGEVANPTGAASTGEVEDYQVTIAQDPGKIGDRVWYDTNSNTQQDDGATGINGVTVYLRQDSCVGTILDTKVTSGDGGYLFTGLAAGTYCVDVDNATVPATYNLTTGNEPLLIVLNAGQTRLDADFGYVVPAPTYTLSKKLNTIDPLRNGEMLSFTIRITNTGSVTMTTVPLTDTYDANYLTYVTSVPPSQDTISDGVLNWNDLTSTPAGFGVDLAPGQSFVVIVNFVGREDTTTLPAQAPCTVPGNTCNVASVAGAKYDPDGSGPLPELGPLPPQSAHDDVQIVVPTGVDVVDATATGWVDGVTVGWRTENETNIVGFNLIRVGMDGQQTLNNELILAQSSGQATGSAYEFVDGGVIPGAGYAYRLQVVRTDSEPTEMPLGQVTAHWYVFVSHIAR
jgi:uncharacterized repeat protein (TIGR01451 family)